MQVSGRVRHALSNDRGHRFKALPIHEQGLLQEEEEAQFPTNETRPAGSSEDPVSLNKQFLNRHELSSRSDL